MGVDPVYYLKDAAGDHYFNVRGTLDDWKDNVARHCAQSSRQVFALAVAFTAPLLELLNEESFGVNLYGSSSKGKSTAQMAAGSVFGGGTGNEKYIRSWRATANGLESIASLHNSTPLILDEMGQIDPREVGEISYMLSNETGKTRATKTGSTRKTLRWKLTCISSGEIKISEHMQSAGKKAKAGQEIRMLDVPMTPSMQNGFDIFAGDPKEGATTADQIQAGARKFYGQAARTFIEALVTRREELLPGVQESIKRFCTEVQIESNQVARVVKKFALIAAAGELAIDLGILPFEKEICFRAVQTCFQDWLTGWGSGDREVSSALEQIKDFINMHGESRFVEIRGKERTDRRENVQNKVGYRGISSTVDASARVLSWWITTTGFKEIAKGHDPRTTINALQTSGFLMPQSNGPTQQRRDPLTNQNQRFYILKADIAGGENVIP